MLSRLSGAKGSDYFEDELAESSLDISASKPGKFRESTLATGRILRVRGGLGREDYQSVRCSKLTADGRSSFELVVKSFPR